MKLRLLDNSLRIRIQRGELDTLYRQGRLEGATHFGTTPDAAWRYALERTPNAAPLSVTFRQGLLTIGISPDVLGTLAGTEQVGVEALIPLDPNQSLKVVLEKDFACLTPREEDTDTFPHPATPTC